MVVPAGLNAKPRTNPFYMNKWLFTTTAYSGDVKSEIALPYSTPYVDPARPENITLISGEKTQKGSGPGGGFELSGLRGPWFFNVYGYRFRARNTDGAELYNATQTSRTTISAQTYYVSYSWRSESRIVEPFVGAGYFEGLGPHLETNIRGWTTYSPEINRYLYYYNQNVSVRVSNPYPQVGLRFKLPIQNWYIAPFYSYSFESATTRVASLPGNVVAAGSPLEAPGNIYDHVLSRAGLDTLQAFNVKIREKHWNQSPGVELYMDFRRFISLRIIAYRNVTHGRWLARGVFNFMFHPNVGITIAGVYNERYLSTLRYAMAGPTVVFQF